MRTLRRPVLRSGSLASNEVSVMLDWFLVWDHIWFGVIIFVNASLTFYNILFLGSTSSRFTPAYYHVLPKMSATVEQKMSDPAPSKDATPVPAAPAVIASRQTGINTGDCQCFNSWHQCWRVLLLSSGAAQLIWLNTIIYFFNRDHYSPTILNESRHLSADP